MTEHKKLVGGIKRREFLKTTGAALTVAVVAANVTGCATQELGGPGPSNRNGMVGKRPRYRFDMTKDVHRWELGREEYVSMENKLNGVIQYRSPFRGKIQANVADIKKATKLKRTVRQRMGQDVVRQMMKTAKKLG